MSISNSNYSNVGGGKSLSNSEYSTNNKSNSEYSTNQSERISAVKKNEIHLSTKGILTRGVSFRVENEGENTLNKVAEMVATKKRQKNAKEKNEMFRSRSTGKYEISQMKIDLDLSSLTEENVKENLEMIFGFDAGKGFVKGASAEAMKQGLKKIKEGGDTKKINEQLQILVKGLVELRQSIEGDVLYQTIFYQELLTLVNDSMNNESIELLCAYGAKDQAQTIDLSKKIIAHLKKPDDLIHLIEKLTKYDLRLQTKDTFFRNTTMSGTLSKVTIEEDKDMKALAEFPKKIKKALPIHGSEISVTARDISDKLKKKVENFELQTINEQEKMINSKVEENEPKFAKLCTNMVTDLFQQKFSNTVRRVLETRMTAFKESVEFKGMAFQGVSSFLILNIIAPPIWSAGSNSKFVTPLKGTVIKNVGGVIQKFAEAQVVAEKKEDKKFNASENAYRTIKPNLYGSFLDFMKTNLTSDKK